MCIIIVNTIADTSHFTCDYCDLQEVENLTNMFLDKLTAATLNRHPRNVSERKINALKNEMIDILQLPSSASTTVPGNPSPKGSFSMAPYAYVKVSESLDSFITSCRTTLSMASSVFKSGDVGENWSQRQQEVDRCFSVEERHEWAKLMLRKHDVEFSYHCSVRNCGPSCVFAVEACPNLGCCVYFSRKWAQQHDAICPEKMLPCTRACGEHRKRKKLETHLRDECILRPIDCPYKSVGCNHGN